MASKVKGYRQGNFLSPMYNLWIAGTKISVAKKKYITQIKTVETDEGSDSAEISISDPKMVFINDNIYTENRKVKIKMGFRGFTYRHTFNGYITNVDIDFPENGVPTLNITCMDNTYRMNKKKKNRTFKKKTNAQIVRTICKSYGFKCVRESGYKFEKHTVSQSDQTDIEFITKLAQDEVHPFTATLVGNTFYYVKRGKLDKTPKQTLRYRKYPNDIISFSPSINTETKELTSGSTKKKNKSQKVSSGSSKKDNQNDSGSSKASTSTKSSRKSTPSRVYDSITRKWKSK